MAEPVQNVRIQTLIGFGMLITLQIKSWQVTRFIGKWVPQGFAGNIGQQDGYMVRASTLSGSVFREPPRSRCSRAGSRQRH